jgi:hypothetical protein
MSNDYPATSTEIIYCFEEIEHHCTVAHNWGTGPHRDDDPDTCCCWSVNDETYINGIVLTIDGDFWMGYLLECVDRTLGTVSYIAYNAYYGRNKETGEQKHDYTSYEPTCGTFFERTPAADHITVAKWAVDQIYRMSESFFEDKR